MVDRHMALLLAPGTGADRRRNQSLLFAGRPV